MEPASYAHWQEKMYAQSQHVTEGHQFFTEALRGNYLEGKVGYRESVGLKNLPPVVVEQPRQPGQIG